MRLLPHGLLAMAWLAGCGLRAQTEVETPYRFAYPYANLAVDEAFVTAAVGPEALALCRDQLALGVQGCSMRLSPCATLVVFRTRPSLITLDIEQCRITSMDPVCVMKCPEGQSAAVLLPERPGWKLSPNAPPYEQSYRMVPMEQAASEWVCEDAPPEP